MSNAAGDHFRPNSGEAKWFVISIVVTKLKPRSWALKRYQKLQNRSWNKRVIVDLRSRLKSIGQNGRRGSERWRPRSPFFITFKFYVILVDPIVVENVKISRDNCNLDIKLLAKPRFLQARIRLKSSFCQFWAWQIDNSNIGCYIKIKALDLGFNLVQRTWRLSLNWASYNRFCKIAKNAVVQNVAKA